MEIIKRGGCRDQDIPSMASIDFAEWFSCLTRLQDFPAFAGHHKIVFRVSNIKLIYVNEEYK